MKKLCSIGDSISVHYREYLISFLEDEFKIITKDGLEEAYKDLDIPAGANIGDSRMLRDYLVYENGKETITYDYVMFNCGLHDIKANIDTGVKQVLIEDYEINLSKALDIWQENKVEIIFINSTPVIDKIHNSPERIAINKIKRSRKDLLDYNAVAEKVMTERAIPVIDLFSFTDTFGEEAFCDHAHFTPEVRKLQAAYLAGAVQAIIK